MKRGFAPFLSCLFLSACSLLGARKDVEQIQDATVIVGNVVLAGEAMGNPPPVVVVAAFQQTVSGPEIAHYAILHEPGAYELMVPKGRYGIFAFADRNRNLVFDEGEESAYYGGGSLIEAGAKGLVTSIDLSLGHEVRAKGFHHGFALAPKPIAPYHSSLAGALANLDEEIFSSRYGEKGYWKGVEFFREVGGNIYFLEPYDPKRIPVLFIHGALGSPQDFRAMFERLDKRRYQAWFFYYPSASAIEPIASLLGKKVWDLQMRYHFSHLHLVAHSAGGLVARSFLVNFGAYCPFIDSFVSISTPWGGEALARLGVKHSPVVIPSWEDMQPDSPFFHRLYERRLPPSVKHYMLFGYRGGLNLLRPYNDGAVTLASQLDPRAQSEAAASYGFDEDHEGILRSREVFEKLYALWASAEGRGRANGDGSLLIDFSEPGWAEAVRPAMTIVVEREGGGKPLYAAVEAGARQLSLDALEPGNYRLRVRSLVMRSSEPDYLVRVESGKQNRLELKLSPRGGVCGFAVDAASQGEVSAGTVRTYLENLHFTAVELRGEGLSRQLRTKAGKALDYDFDSDALFDGVFCFTDLPRGRYELRVEVEGFEDYAGSREVEPGELGQTFYIPLRRNRGQDAVPP